MTTQRSIRAADQDRESVVAILREAYASGCLDIREHEQRVAGAYRARTLGELQDLVADLPVWLLERPAPSPRESCYGQLPRRQAPELPIGLILVFAGFWVVIAVVAWAPFMAAPFGLGWLLLALFARDGRPRRRFGDRL